MKTPHLPFLLLGLLAAAPRPAPAQGAPPLQAALATVDAGEIRSDLEFIAADELRGRDTVSRGQRIAARYLRARLQRLGFRPGAGDRYLYEYPLESRTLDPASLGATLARGGQERELVHGRDYQVVGGWAVTDLDTEGGVVFGGAGEREDLQAGEPAGNWLLVRWSGQNLWRLAWPARRAGAVGLLLATDPAAESEPVLEHFAGAGGLGDPRVSWPASTQGGQRRSPFPVLALSDELAAELLAGDPAPGAALDAHLHERRAAVVEPVAAEDVCGLWPGRDPALRNEVILLSAHYDHVGASGKTIYNGADDNGSGTCGLLAVAEALAAYGPMRRSVLLIWVSGEEKGLWGSRAWAEQPLLPEGMRPVADINIDMIGRNAPETLFVTPSPEHDQYNRLTEVVQRCAALEGFPALGSADEYWGRSDHAMFARLGIPVCFLFAGEHEDYHRPTDTADKIDYDKIRRVVRTVVRTLDALQEDDLSLAPAAGD
ncbi:MAG: M28 family peptidase [Planctomycetota bacterium]|nr:MAG: M28 family peptidase [Planctomycetota bacterium]